jgi:hypothetical protein
MNETRIQKTTRDFALNGYEQSCGKPQLDGTHRHVLANKYDNFYGKSMPTFKLHRWAGSLTSSQAFAYNIFSGVKNVKFEYDMWALDNNPQRKACVDIAIENQNVVDMYEVKMFEFVSCVGKNQIFHKKEQEKYFHLENYCCSTEEIKKNFMIFIKDVRKYFKDRPIYGEGIKQLCCHLLGISNEMTKYDKLRNKKVRLYSLCFDYNIGSGFIDHKENYKDVLNEFSDHVKNYLNNINLQDVIEYCGYLGASEYIKNNKDLLGEANCDYVKKRYCL